MSYVDCPKCKGLGKQYDGIAMPCDNCNGMGFVWQCEIPKSICDMYYPNCATCELMQDQKVVNENNAKKEAL